MPDSLSYVSKSYFKGEKLSIKHQQLRENSIYFAKMRENEDA